MQRIDYQIGILNARIDKRNNTDIVTKDSAIKVLERQPFACVPMFKKSPLKNKVLVTKIYGPY